MKKNIATKWVKALRSGKYKQAFGALCSFDEHGKPSGYCCLGVLTCLAPKELQGELLSIAHEQYGCRSAAETLTKPLMEWSGMRSDIGYFGSYWQSLSERNDAGMSFAEIADIIEKEWEAL